MINIRSKGQKGERDLCKILNDRFSTKAFKRSVQSGAFTGGKNSHRADDLTSEQSSVFIGDIITPPDFLYTIEHKCIAKFDFWDIHNKNSQFWKWIQQAERDAVRANRDFMLVIKPNLKPRLVVMADNAKCYFPSHMYILCKGLVVMLLDDLLRSPNDFFFREKIKRQHSGENWLWKNLQSRTRWQSRNKYH